MAVNFTGIQALQQKQTLQNAPKADIAFQAKSQADTVSFGMISQATKAGETASKSKLGQQIINKIIDMVKDVFNFIVKLFKTPKAADPTKVMASQMGTYKGWPKSMMN